MVKKQVSEADMMTINVSVARSNPLILRKVHIPEDKTAKDLIALACISVGRESKEEGKLFLSDDTDTPVKQEEILSDILKSGDQTRIFLYEQQGKKKSEKGLILFADVENVMKESSEKAEGARSLPYISLAVGYNLPAEKWDIAEINRIQQEIKASSTYKAEDGTYYSDKNLEFSEKRINNSIRKYFAPETAAKEINMALGMPMIQMFSTLKVDEMKSMADVYGIYYDSATRKPDLIHSFCRKFDRRAITEMFDEMGIKEYLRFRELVLSEKEPELSGDWEDDYFEFYDRGLLSKIPKTGLRIASEVLDFYEEWYGTEKEHEYICGKYIETALKVCALLYGVFRMPQFIAVLEKIRPEDLGKKEIEAYFKQHGYMPLKNTVYASEGFEYYYAGDLSSDRVKYILKQNNPLSYFVPEPNEIYRFAERGLTLSEQSDKALRKIIGEWTYRRSYYYSYSYSDDSSRIEESYQAIVKALQLDGDITGTMAVVERNLEKLRWDSKKEAVLARVESILTKEVKILPLLSLNGYSEKNCPKELREYRAELARKREEELRAAKAREEKRRENVKKKAVTTKAVTVKKYQRRG